MTKNDWIVLKYDVQPNIMICERCKQEQVMPEGSMPFLIMESLMKAFEKIHKNCKVKNETS